MYRNYFFTPKERRNPKRKDAMGVSPWSLTLLKEVFSFIPFRDKSLTGFKAKFFSGFTLIELLIVTAILIFVLGGIFTVLTVGQRSWQQSDVEIEVQQDLRKAMTRITKELRESGFNALGTSMVTIQDNTGEYNTDILEFMVPVDYDDDGDILDAAGNIEWGAPTLWANKDPDCEGPQNSCQYLNYKIDYLVNPERQFIRRVLDDGGATVREDIFANNIQDFQVSRDNKIVTIELTARKVTVFGRTITKSLSSQIYLRNQG